MRILLVEDEHRMAQALCEILRLEKYEVDHFDNGLDALEAIQSDIYDIAILDVMLPGLNGFEITKRARSKNIHTPILLLTLSSSSDLAVRRRIGVWMFLLRARLVISNPFKPGNITSRIAIS